MQFKKWGIYDFCREWLTEEVKSKSNKKYFRPCILFAQKRERIILIPMSSSPSSPKWNIRYISATRKKVSHIHIDKILILDSKSIKMKRSKINCKIRNNIKHNIPAKLSSKNIKNDIELRVSQYLKQYFNLISKKEANK